MHRKLLTVVVLLLLALPLYVLAQDSVSFSDPADLVYLWYDDVEDMAVCNDVAVVALESSVRVIDLSDPEQPFETARLLTGSYWIRGLATYEDYIYVLHWSSYHAGRITVIDASDPALLATVGEIDVSYQYGAIQVHDNLLMIGGNSFTVMSLENPILPEILSTSYTIGGSNGFCVADTLVYTVGQGKINVINIANLENIRSIYDIEVDINSTDCAVYNGFLYATYQYPTGQNAYTAGVVLSLETPATPVLLGYFRLHSHVTEAYYGISNYGDLLFLHGKNRVVLCEAGDTAQDLVVVAEYRDSYRTFFHGTINDNTLYTIMDENEVVGMQNFSITDSSITPLGMPYWREGTYLSHEHRDNYVYAFVSPYDLFCFDVTDPNNPVTISGSCYDEVVVPYELKSYQCDEYIYNNWGWRTKCIRHI